MRDYSRFIWFVTDKSALTGNCHINVILSGCNTALLQKSAKVS